MITNYKTLPYLSLATCALIGAFTSFCAIAADTAIAATTTTQPRPTQEQQLAKATAASTPAQKDHLQSKGSSSTLTATAARRLAIFRRPNEDLARHVTTFRGPIGPTLPAGATLHRNPAAVGSLLEVTAAPDDFIFELPPGAFLRKTVIAQTQ